MEVHHLNKSIRQRSLKWQEFEKKDQHRIVPELVLYSSPSTEIRVIFRGLFLLLELGTSKSSAESAGGGITSCLSSFSSSCSFSFSSDAGLESEISFISSSTGLVSSTGDSEAGVSEGTTSLSVCLFSVFSPSVTSLASFFDGSGSANLVQSGKHIFSF